jgi:predicted CoA-binding protein
MRRPTVAIIGASVDRSKYGNIALRAHIRAGYEVFPVNPKAREVEGLVAYASIEDVPVDRLDRVSVYVPPEITLELLPSIAARNPGEVWLNPGTDSRRVLARAAELGLEVIRGCSIIDATCG